MKNYRCYGRKPYRVVVVHGGPGALGDMGYVADKLSAEASVVEALQTKNTVDGLVDELIETIVAHCEPPVVLIGHSWGAWLAYMVAAEYPNLVSKLVLVGSGPFRVNYASEIESTRLNRLSLQERKILEDLLRKFYNDSSADKSKIMSKIGAMIERADAFSLRPINDIKYQIKVDGDMFGNIWSEAEKLRSSGKLLSMATKLKCDVIIVPGDYDPHPARGVIEPLSENVESVQSIILKKCGHYPWKETFAHDEFFQVLLKITGDL